MQNETSNTMSDIIGQFFSRLEKLPADKAFEASVSFLATYRSFCESNHYNFKSALDASRILYAEFSGLPTASGLN